MLIINAERKKTVKLHMLICMLLIVLSVVFSFLPLAKISLKSSEQKSEFQNQINEFVGETADFQIPDAVEINGIKTVKAIKLFVKLISGATSTAKSGDTSGLEEAIFDSNGNVKEDVKETLIISVVLVSSIVGETINGENSFSKSGFGAIIFMLMSIAAVMYIVIFSVVVPIIYIIMFLISLKTALGHEEGLDRGEYYAKNIHKVSGKLPRLITFPLLFMLFPYILSRATYGTGTLLLIITALVCVVVNVFFSRINMKGYSKNVANGKEIIKNANVVQGVSLITLIGLLVFVFSFMKTGIVQSFFFGTGKNWSNYAVEASVVSKASKAFLIDALLIIIMGLLLFIAFPKYVGKDLQRFSLAGKRDNHFGLALLTLAIVILPMLVAKFEHGYNNFIDSKGGAYSLLNLSSEQEAALTLSLVGAIIAFASEIAIVALKKALHVTVDKEEFEKAMNDGAVVEENNEPVKEAAATTAAADTGAVAFDESDNKSK